MPSIAPIVHKVVGNDHEETERDRSSPFRKEEVGIVRGRQHCQQQGGQGAGGGNMVKTSELLLNIVSWNRLMMGEFFYLWYTNTYMLCSIRS